MKTPHKKTPAKDEGFTSTPPPGLLFVCAFALLALVTAIVMMAMG